MKRSKLYLSIAAGILAVVALGATKATKFTTRHIGYYSLNFGPCTASCGISYYTGRAAGAAQAICNGLGARLFSYNIASCITPLYTRKSAD
jgi:hypothetical protein